MRGADETKLAGDLTIRGVTRPVTLDVRYLCQWKTPWWEDGVDKGPKTRAGFLATRRINRKDFGVNWNGTLDRFALTRKRAKLTQTVLSERIGYTQQAVAQAERWSSNLTIGFARRWAKACWAELGIELRDMC